MDGGTAVVLEGGDQAWSEGCLAPVVTRNQDIYRHLATTSRIIEQSAEPLVVISNCTQVQGVQGVQGVPCHNTSLMFVTVATRLVSDVWQCFEHRDNIHRMQCRQLISTSNHVLTIFKMWLHCTVKQFGDPWRHYFYSFWATETVLTSKWGRILQEMQCQWQIN